MFDLFQHHSVKCSTTDRAGKPDSNRFVCLTAWDMAPMLRDHSYLNKCFLFYPFAQHISVFGPLVDSVACSLCERPVYSVTSCCIPPCETEIALANFARKNISPVFNQVPKSAYVKLLTVLSFVSHTLTAFEFEWH